MKGGGIMEEWKKKRDSLLDPYDDQIGRAHV